MQSTVLNAARCAFFAGAIAAAYVSSPLAAPAVDEAAFSAQPVSATQVPQLNLSSLESRVRETRAISVLQKIALQQEVDELLARFRAAHRSGNTELTPLRPRFDRLLTNIQGLLRHDPQLANEIAASREAIWEVLADRSKFASL